VEHLCQVYDLICIGFWDIMWKNRQTHGQTEVKKTNNPAPTTVVGMGNGNKISAVDVMLTRAGKSRFLKKPKI